MKVFGAAQNSLLLFPEPLIHGSMRARRVSKTKVIW